MTTLLSTTKLRNGNFDILDTLGMITKLQLESLTV